MSYTFTSTLECLLRVKESGGIAEVYLENSGIQYTISSLWDWDREGGKEDKRKFIPDHRLASVDKVDQFILNTLSEGGKALIGYERGILYSFYSVHDHILLYFGEIKQYVRKKKGLPTLELDNGIICSKSEDYCKAFGLEPTYINKGRVMRWANGQEAPKKKLKTPKNLVYEPRKVLNLESTKNSFGKPSVILSYTGCVPIRGLTNIVKTFPHITLTQIAALYKRFGITLPPSAKRYFNIKGEPISKTRPPRKKKSLSVYDSWDDSKDSVVREDDYGKKSSVTKSQDSVNDPGVKEKIGFYIREYDIRKNLSDPDTLLMYHYLKDNDTTISSVSDLAHTIRVSGGSISQKMAKAVWTQVMGRGE